MKNKIKRGQAPIPNNLKSAQHYGGAFKREEMQHRKVSRRRERQRVVPFLVDRLDLGWEVKEGRESRTIQESQTKSNVMLIT